MKARITPGSQVHQAALMSSGQRPRRRGAQRGAVLMVSLGVLFLLAMFAVSFAQVTALERAASANHITRIESSTVCSGGLQAGIQVVRNFTRDNGVTGFFEARDENGQVVTKSDGTPQKFPHPFFIPGQPRPDTNTPGRDFGVHVGSLTGTGRYKVRIIDCSGQINVNDTYDTAHIVLRRMLITLGQALEANTALDLDFNPLSEADVTAIIEARLQQPGGVFASKEAVFRSLPAQSTSGKNRSQRFAAFRNFITVHSWQDGSLVGAAPDTSPDGEAPPLPRPYVDDQGTGLLLSARSPVNINVAPAEVIAAVLAGLCANAYHINTAGTPVARGASVARIDSLEVPPISFDQARALAATIVAWREKLNADPTLIAPRGPFTSWAEFERFVLTIDSFSDNQGSGAVRDYKQEMTDVIDEIPGALRDALATLTRPQLQAVVANADPNARLVGVQPADPARLQTFGEGGNNGVLIDKAVVRFVPNPNEPGTRLDNGTTEFCFGSTGYFEILSLGRMATWDDEGTPRNLHDDEPLREFARHGRRVIIKLFHTLRHTSQRDFRQAYDRALGSLLGVSGIPTFKEARTADGLRFESHPNLADDPSAVDGWIQLASPGRNDLLVILGLEDAHAGLPVLESFDDGPDAKAPGQGTNTRDTGSVLRGGDSDDQGASDPGDFGPDGMICWANPNLIIPDALSIPTAKEEFGDDTVNKEGGGGQDSAVNIGQGSIEFWYRPFTDGDLGSSEPLIHLVRRGERNTQISNFAAENASNAQKDAGQGAGMCLRVGRYGDKLIAVIFYWGLPEGSLPPEVLVNRLEPGIQPNSPSEDVQAEFEENAGPDIFQEVATNLSTLLGGGASRAGEWHHVYVSWRNLTELSLFIDGKKVDDDDSANHPFEDRGNEGNSDGVQRQPPSGGIDAGAGRDANTFLRRINADGTQDTTDGGSLSDGEPTITGLDAIKLVRLISQSDRNRLYVGGIQDEVSANLGALGVNVHTVGESSTDEYAVSNAEGEVRRGTNAVIDDVIIYNDPDELLKDEFGNLLGKPPTPKRFAEFDGSVDSTKNPVGPDESLTNNIEDDKRSQFIGAFALPRLPPSDDSSGDARSHAGGYEFGTVHFTIRQPDTWQGFKASTQGFVRVSTRGKVEAFTDKDSSRPRHLQVTGVKDVASGSSLPKSDRFIPLSGPRPPLIFYQVEFRNALTKDLLADLPDDQTPTESEEQATRNSTPLFDDITVTVFPPGPQIVEQLFDSDIN